jgi:hypothetical protein
MIASEVDRAASDRLSRKLSLDSPGLSDPANFAKVLELTGEGVRPRSSGQKYLSKKAVSSDLLWINPLKHRASWIT